MGSNGPNTGHDAPKAPEKEKFAENGQEYQEGFQSARPAPVDVGVQEAPEAVDPYRDGDHQGQVDREEDDEERAIRGAGFQFRMANLPRTAFPSVSPSGKTSIRYR